MIEFSQITAINFPDGCTARLHNGKILTWHNASIDCIKSKLTAEGIAFKGENFVMIQELHALLGSVVTFEITSNSENKRKKTVTAEVTELNVSWLENIEYELTCKSAYAADTLSL